MVLFGVSNMLSDVYDCGMVTLKNVEQLRQAGQGYLVGLQRRNRKDIPHYIEQALARDDWQECPAGIAASERAAVPRTRVQEVAGKEPGVRVYPAPGHIAPVFLPLPVFHWRDRAGPVQFRSYGS